MTADYQFVIEVTVAIDASGTLQTCYFCTGNGFATTPSDTPANTWVEPRVINAGNIRRELFSGNRVFGAVRPSFGEIVLANSDGGLDSWVGYGVVGHPVVIRYGQEGSAYPSGYTDVLKVRSDGITVDFDRVAIRIKDRLKLLDRPVLNQTFTGAGGLQGSEAGVSKQRVFGDPGYLPLQSIDPASLIYFVQQEHAGGQEASFKLYEGGVEVTRGANYTSDSDCTTNAPTAGQCRFWFGASGAGPVYVRLGSTPTYELRCYAAGYASAGGVLHTTGSLAAEAGVTGASGGTAIYNRYVADNSLTYLDLFDDNASLIFYFYGFDKTDTFRTTTFAAPAVSALYNFNQHNCLNISRTPPQDMAAPVYKITANIGQMYKSPYASGATATMKDYLQRDWWVKAISEDTSILNKHPGALAVNIDCLIARIKTASGWTAIKNAYMALFGVERDFYQITTQLNTGTLALDLHDTVELKLPRFGLSAGKKFRIVAQTLDLQSREITYGLWG